MTEMPSLPPIQTPSPKTLRLAIGTWFFKLLVGSSPGGLPADFFTHAASSLLLFDEIICDSEAYESEMDFASRRRGRTEWLSSIFYRELKEEGILRPVPYRQEVADVIANFNSHGADARVRTIMEQERIRLRDKPRAAQGPLNAELRSLNAAFSLELAGRGLTPYDWREGHLRPANISQLLADRSSSGEVGSSPKHLKRFQLPLPQVTVLQSSKWVASVDNAASRGFDANVARERLPLYLWMYDDPEWTREKYNKWRLGAEFKGADLAFDRAREPHARKSLDTILRLRHDTTQERAAVQAIVKRGIDGELNSNAFLRELEQHLQIYETLRGSEKPKLNLVVASMGVVGSVALAALHGLGLGLVSLGAEAAVEVAAGALAAAHLTTAARGMVQSARARQDEPVGWFVSEIRRRLK